MRDVFDLGYEESCSELEEASRIEVLEERYAICTFKFFYMYTHIYIFIYMYFIIDLEIFPWQKCFSQTI